MAISNSAVENRGPAFEPGDMEGEQIAQMFGELTKLIDKMNAKKSSASSNVGSDPNFSQPVGPVAECLLSGGPSFSSIAVSAEKHPDDEASKLLEVCEASKYEESITEADAVWNDLQNRAIKVMQRRREKRSAGGGIVTLAEHQKALKRLEEMREQLAETVPLGEHRAAVDRIEVAEEKLNENLIPPLEYRRVQLRAEGLEDKAEHIVPRDMYASVEKRVEDAERMIVVVSTAVGKVQERVRLRKESNKNLTDGVPTRSGSKWFLTCMTSKSMENMRRSENVVPDACPGVQSAARFCPKR
eukprot:CAMPEP_0194498352 /NCGR_PEP_ID=MMETSP0253-20130528/15011_1 /TAXON_ID=2966 /ORGANISM="Noctiluca scintillans" /LENGTH=299 /DNA_ID=CAMNT_0039339985 /DNA_START=117 /DNA_END=1016 /DNA_ORIENTATION=+